MSFRIRASLRSDSSAIPKCWPTRGSGARNHLRQSPEMAAQPCARRPAIDWLDRAHTEDCTALWYDPAEVVWTFLIAAVRLLVAGPRDTAPASAAWTSGFDLERLTSWSALQPGAVVGYLDLYSFFKAHGLVPKLPTWSVGLNPNRSHTRSSCGAATNFSVSRSFRTALNAQDSQIPRNWPKNCCGRSHILTFWCCSSHISGNSSRNLSRRFLDGEPS